MFQRVMVAVIGVPLLLVILLFLPSIAIPIAIAALSMIGVHEVLWSTGFVKNPYLSGFSIALAGLIPFWVYLGHPFLPALAALFLYFLAVCVTAISSNFAVTVEKMGGCFFFAALIAFFLSSLIRIDQLEGGKYFILLPFAASFLSDACALFAGMLWGKHKLAPKLSPKKTVEGAVGGFVGAMLGMVIYGLVLSLGFKLPVSYPVLVLYGALGSIVSQIGDLSFSYIKRQYGIKDFGNIFPGHGGVLDRFDSVIFCAPLMEILLRLLPVIPK